MNFSVSKGKLLEELQLLQGIVEKRNTMPILSNILMIADASGIEMTGTDLEVGLRTRIDAAIEEHGAITVNGKKFFEIVKSLPEDQEVRVERKGDSIEIRAGESEFRIMCLPREDYPQVPEAKFEKNIRLPLKDLKDMIDRVYYAITQEQRYYLNGALLNLSEKKMELVSTDGHRLSYTMKKEDGLMPEKDISVIVAKKTLNELRKFDDESVEFDMDDNNLFFRVGERVLISRIIESKFPNYQAVIPKDNPGRLSIGRAGLSDAVRRVSLLSAERSKGIKFTIEKNVVKLFSSNPEIGEARDRLDVNYRGQDFEIGFNSQYLLDFLGSGEFENVVFEIKDENSAVLLKPEAEGTIHNTYVLMPMKI